MTQSATTDAPWKAVLARVRTFPTLPMIVNKITELVNLPETTARDIEAVVEKDQVLTSKLLRLVNSPFYGFPKKITTVARAVGIIGFDALRSLVFSTSVIRLFKLSEAEAFRPVEFWKHSIGTGLAAKALALRMGEKRMEDFFVGGLLHDIGKLVHYEFFGEGFQRVLALVAERDILIREAEREVLGFTHDQTGGLLLTQWNLPSNLIAMAAFHHQPSEAHEHPREAGIIHLADILCRAMGLGSGGDATIPLLDRPTFDRLGLTVGDLEHVMRRLTQDFEAATEAFLD